jgi:acetaldehyde dehydrogenase (acetylating)
VANVAIVGAGKGGTSILKALAGIPGITVVGICDVNSDAPGMKAARELGVRAFTELDGITNQTDLDVIFEATGNENVRKAIEEKKNADTALIDSHAPEEWVPHPIGFPVAASLLHLEQPYPGIGHDTLWRYDSEGGT